MASINELEKWISGLIPEDRDKGDKDYSPVLRAIEDRVAYHIDNDPGLLMSYLYRLDVEEDLVRKAMDEHSSVHLVKEIARLIFERQLKRLETKRQFGKSVIDDKDWSW